MPNISYLITCHDETKTLRNLFNRLDQHIDKENDEVIILDDFSDNEETKKILSEASNQDYVCLYQHALERDYGSHKNYGTKLCKNSWIFQLDGDENPSTTLLLNIKEIIDENSDVELFTVPRINDFRGVSHDHAKQWGWRLTPSPSCKNRLIVNWPDYQGRCYRNIPDKIKWNRRLHEKLEGYTKFSALPEDEDLALYHDKTIETQLNTNKRYNELFTVDENRGHPGFTN